MAQSKSSQSTSIKDITETKNIKVAETPTAPQSQTSPDIEVEAPESIEAQEAAQSEIKTTEQTEIKQEEQGKEEAAKETAAKEKFDCPKGHTVFITKSKEHCVEIYANGRAYDAKYDASKKLGMWIVADEDVKSFSQHMFVQHSKITKALK